MPLSDAEVHHRSLATSHALAASAGVDPTASTPMDPMEDTNESAARDGGRANGGEGTAQAGRQRQAGRYAAVQYIRRCVETGAARRAQPSLIVSSDAPNVPPHSPALRDMGSTDPADSDDVTDGMGMVVFLPALLEAAHTHSTQGRPTRLTVACTDAALALIHVRILSGRVQQ